MECGGGGPADVVGLEEITPAPPPLPPDEGTYCPGGGPGGWVEDIKAAIGAFSSIRSGVKGCGERIASSSA